MRAQVSPIDELQDAIERGSSGRSIATLRRITGPLLLARAKPNFDEFDTRSAWTAARALCLWKVRCATHAQAPG